MLSGSWASASSTLGQPSVSWWFVRGDGGRRRWRPSRTRSAGIFAQKSLASARGPTLAAASMLGGALALLPLALAQSARPGARLEVRSRRSPALTLAGTVLAQLILFRAIRLHGSARTSLVTYLMPPIALVYGAVLLDEPVTAASLGGLALILVGVALGSGAVLFARRAAAIQEP